ncbi:14020_t:CDS:2 [Entrophospora sp. SA101]|nr:14020_t:CDS:2 [Entrophospora sp. SA101]
MDNRLEFELVELRLRDNIRRVMLDIEAIDILKLSYSCFSDVNEVGVDAAVDGVLFSCVDIELIVDAGEIGVNGGDNV